MNFSEFSDPFSTVPIEGFKGALNSMGENFGYPFVHRILFSVGVTRNVVMYEQLTYVLTQRYGADMVIAYRGARKRILFITRRDHRTMPAQPIARHLVVWPCGPLCTHTCESRDSATPVTRRQQSVPFHYSPVRLHTWAYTVRISPRFRVKAFLE